jgi:hypothetical protein
MFSAKIGFDDELLQVNAQLTNLREVETSTSGESCEKAFRSGIGAVNLGEGATGASRLSVNLSSDCPLSNAMLAGNQDWAIALRDASDRTLS